MKKIVLGFSLLALGLLALGLWWVIRKKPGELPLAEGTQAAFQFETVELGARIHYEDPQTPLRALRWVPARERGILVNQRITQSDRQMVTLFKDGAFSANCLVPKPPGVRDGFFRLAELKEVVITEEDVAVLLYLNPGSGPEELPLIMALDLRTNDLRWFHRGPGDRIVLSGGPDAAVYQFGAEAPPTRLPLAVAAGERMSPAGARSSAQTLELPPEVPRIGDLLPTGPRTFLLAHQNGLSAYLGSKGWLHHAAPEGNPGVAKEAVPVLAASGKKYWWQPAPGQLVQVLADGTPKSLWSPMQFMPAEPFEKDAPLLHLLGVGANEVIWFDLAVPAQSQSVDGGTPEAAAKPGEEPGAAPPAAADWQAYASQGLDRIYTWDPQKRSLQRCRLSGLKIPPGFSRPANGASLVPASEALTLDAGASVWVLPLASLTFGEATATGKPDQLK